MPNLYQKKVFSIYDSVICLLSHSAMSGYLQNTEEKDEYVSSFNKRKQSINAYSSEIIINFCLILCKACSLL